MTVRRFRKTYLRLLTLPGYSQLLMNNRCSSPSCSFEPVPPRSCFPAQVARWCPPSAIHPPLFTVRFVSAPSTPPQLGTTAAFIQTTNSPSVAFHCSFFIWAAQWDLVILLRWLTIYHKRKDSHFLNFRHFSQYRHICSMCVLMIFVKGQIWCWRWGSLVAPAALSVVLTPGPTGCLRVNPSESVEEMPSHRHAWQTVAPHFGSSELCYVESVPHSCFLAQKSFLLQQALPAVFVTACVKERGFCSHPPSITN